MPEFVACHAISREELYSQMVRVTREGKNRGNDL